MALLSQRIIRSISKYILQFTDYWFENYVFKILPLEIITNKNLLLIFRTQTIETISAGLRGIATSSIEEDAYFQLGLAQFRNGLSYEQTVCLRFEFEKAMEMFLYEKNKEKQLELTEQEIAQYIHALKQLNETIMVKIVEGYVFGQKNERYNN